MGQNSAYQVLVTAKTWLGPDVFELRVERPPGFAFTAGQKVLLSAGPDSREYTIACGTSGDLRFCIKRFYEGKVSERLSVLEIGEYLRMSGAGGFFIHRKGRAVFVATGTGVAPFVSYVCHGISGFIMLHGAKSLSQLYYRTLLEKAAASYIPCLTEPGMTSDIPENVFRGRVSNYIEEVLPEGIYDFYLCGNSGMVKEVHALIDRKFHQSRIFSEPFY